MTSAPAERPLALRILVAVLFLESAVMAGAAVFILVELFVDRPTSYASAIAILVLAVLAAVWLAVVAVHALRGRAWIRGGAIVWQVLQLAVATGSFQGLFARADVGWLLAVPALLVLVLLFTPSVIRATSHRD